MLSCQNLFVSYRAGEQISSPLRDLSLAIGNESASIMGPSGSGKSTLLRLIAGLQAPDSGVIEIDGVPVSSPQRGATGDPRVTLIHQDYRLIAFLTVAENLFFAAEMRAAQISKSEVSEALAVVGLAGFEDRAPATLSGGEQQRVAIARSLVVGAKVLLADEPTGALDEENTLMVGELLSQLAERGVVVLVATHDRMLANLMTQALELKDGRVANNTRSR